jgi:hypothetical protein
MKDYEFESLMNGGERFKSSPVRPHGVMRDTEGNILMCTCGKPVGMAAIGKDSYIAWCPDCSPNKDAPVAEFVFKPPVFDEYKEIPPHLLDSFTVKLKEGYLACSTLNKEKTDDPTP